MRTIKRTSAGGEQALNWLEKASMAFNALVLFAMMVTVVYGVVMRYVLKSPVHQIAELSAFMMVALTFLVLAYIQRQRQHVRVSFLIVRQGERTQVILGIVTTLCAMVTFVLLTWGGWEFALQALQRGFTSEEAGYPLFPPRLIVPVGSFLMCLRLLADLVYETKSLRSPGARGLKTPEKARMEIG